VTGLGTIFGLTFREAQRRRLVLTVALMGALFLVLFTIGFAIVHRNASFSVVGQRPEFMNFFLMIGMYVVNFLVAMLTVLASVDCIAGEVVSGTIQTIVTKPVRRWQVVLGKWAGLACMMATFVVVMSTGMMAIVRIIGGYLPPHPLAGIALMILEGLVLLTLSILGGTRLTTLANGVVVFMAFGLAFAAGWIEQMADILKNETLASIGIVVSLIIPSEAMWRRASYLMQPPFLRELGFSPFSGTSAPSGIMVVWAAGYVFLGLTVAVWLFRRRDL